MPQLTRAHRVLIGVVITGALIIAGIGFAGSYAAVQALAIKKGFGNFSYVFPVGIDAGICVLLALDLLLTWIRMPFPLLRQTAWLLTAATIAFNGAAAWPDPLGVGMHAVIPVLFVVAVEAARHAIGRIADITADKHMEGVRLTRWLLSPLPTFLLWRRMKLWELRSYDQVIKLEQERLVYQARLRSRYGRAWRRKAPVESLMPLRLARYGIPLAKTAPAGLAAAGITEPPLPFAAEQAPAPAQHTGPETKTPIAPDDGLPWDDYFSHAWPAYAPEHGSHPDAAALATHLYRPDQITGASGQPLTGNHLQVLVTAFPQRESDKAALLPHEEADTSDARQAHGHSRPAEETSEQAEARTGAHPAKNKRPTKVHAAIPHAPPDDDHTHGEPTALTTVDRYYLAWTDYQTHHGHEPKAEQLAADLADQGMHGRGDKPISPSTLRRYLLPFRLYHLWAQQRRHTRTPALDVIAQACVTHGITGQHNKPLTTDYIAHHTRDFERRWQALAHHHTPK
ncbi:DUF2637 domain-containing protein [Streptomyces sp. NPDC004546]|uniref:DUF2637 domain-containing protein n=1 Tax=Streptomyces sp. NPDC004546 TaxID=3154282 RepID=UPI0033BF94CE